MAESGEWKGASVEARHHDCVFCAHGIARKKHEQPPKAPIWVHFWRDKAYQCKGRPSTYQLLLRAFAAGRASAHDEILQGLEELHDWMNQHTNTSGVPDGSLDD